jgi:hypothetical protein
MLGTNDIKKKSNSPYQGLSSSKVMKSEYQASDKATQPISKNVGTDNKTRFSGILTPIRNELSEYKWWNIMRKPTLPDK